MDEEDFVDLIQLSSLIQQEQRRIITLCYRISRIHDLQSEGQNKLDVLRILNKEERQLFLDSIMQIEE